MGKHKVEKYEFFDKNNVKKYFDADSIQDEIEKACKEYGISYGKEKGGFAKSLAEITEKMNPQFYIQKLPEETSNVIKFHQLLVENPNLPIVPMVDSEICSEDYARCMGSFGSSWVDDYCIGQNDRMWCKSDFDNDINEALETILPWHEFEKIPEGKEKEVYDNLPWTKAIIVNIDLP